MAIDFAQCFGGPVEFKESWDGYESSERIVFSDRDTEEQTEETLERRIAAIFSPIEIADQWTKPEGHVPEGDRQRRLDDRYPQPKPFKLNNEQFLKRAYASRPVEPEGRYPRQCGRFCRRRSVGRRGSTSCFAIASGAPGVSLALAG
ncbi:hypothetical protein [Paraburkholderia sp. MM6662-R1]|uniref:hypothetical protein n=1 Tax=Paraburkholderia sp. MM6662-R1 TaxID=2991066 RepID=UPI003D21697F